jgi:hypothetical protein
MPAREIRRILIIRIDANLFKDAFIQAQADNEAAFKKEETAEKSEEAPAPAA